MASDYLALLGTADMTNEAISKELYNLATSYDLNVGAYSTSINISGLSENISKTLDIVEGLITSAVADEDILAALKDDLYKARKDAKMNQRACNGALQRYIYYGPDYIKSTTLTNEAVAALTSEDILGAVKDLLTLSHEVLYYGPDSQDELTAMLSEHHKAAATLTPLEKQHAQYIQTSEPKVIVANYPSRQFNYIQYSNRGETYNAGEAPLIRLFNTYFGGGMNAIVFQEMRESRALAYSAGAYLAEPGYTDQTYWFRATIGSQNDKLRQAVEAFDDIINDMPQSEANLEIAKSNIESDLRTGRTTGMNVLYSYLDAQDLGLSEPIDKLVFEHLDDMTMDNLNATQQKWIKGRKYVYAILGDTSDLDMAFLRTLGPVQTVSLEEIFGY
ncbi:MAG: insulinase family protein [Bacteroidales bacterium]|nr:insulinase family protein [Bacteroidales bacterium]